MFSMIKLIKRLMLMMMMMMMMMMMSRRRRIEDEDEDEEDAILPLCFVICSFVATTLRGHRYVFRPILVFWVQAEGLGS